MFLIIFYLILIILILLSIAFFVVIERKSMGLIQSRKGPNIVGIYGILQSFADGLKLLTKEYILPEYVNSFIFIFSPFLIFIFSFFSWFIIPIQFNNGIDSILGNSYSGLVFLAFSGLMVYGLVLSSFFSKSKYSVLASLRSIAQTISYEITFTLFFIFPFLIVMSLSFNKFVLYSNISSIIYIWLPFLILFIIIALAETNRPPFDLPEAEAELVAGYNTEYSSSGFVLFYLGEYCSMLILSYIFILFVSNKCNLSILSLVKILNIIFIYAWIRASFPRVRFDQLMVLNWKVLLIALPFTLLSVIIVLIYVFKYFLYNFFNFYFTIVRFRFNIYYNFVYFNLFNVFFF